MQPTEDDWFDDTIQTYQSKLIAYATRILGDSDRAKDAVQDAFVKLYQSDRSKIQDHVAPWLYRVVRNLALNIIRKDKRMIQFKISEEIDDSNSSQQRETAESLFEMVHYLQPPKDELIMLKFKDGFSYKEIAAITGLSVSNVGYQLHHAIRELKQQWEAQTTGN